ncbi:MAG TPA: hypothetical protein VFO77_01360, partial [Actinoplanes sp.]|nr:hypothetical protein [Actinoplanes sp.]
MLEQNWRVPRRAQPGDGARRMVLTAAALCAGVGVAVTAAIVLAGSHPTWIPAALRAPTVGAAAIIRFYGGVGTLVALSLTVTVGLLAADRGLLDARRRVRAQSAHRALSVLTVVLLGTHLLTEITAHRIGALDAAVPFLGTTAFLGLGSVAAYLIVAAMWIGIVRGRFAGNGRPGLWRVLHATGYLSWPTALVHGLYAGRTPAVWVVASYLLLLLLVIVALGRRLVAERRHRRAHR